MLESTQNTTQKASRSRRVRRLGAVLATALLLASCGSDSGSGSAPSSAPTPTTAPTTTAPDGGFPVTLEQATGTVTIEERPRRVVTLGYTDTDIATALGAEVVAAVASPFGEDGRNSPWAPTPLGPEVAHLSAVEPDLEAIAAADPDIILAITAYPVVLDTYEVLSEIAPVVTAITGPLLDSPEAVTTTIGTALGEPEAAAALLAEADEAIAAFRTAHPELEGKTAVFAPREGEQTAIFIDESAASVALLARLGLTTPTEVQEIPGDRTFGATFISDERLDLLDSADLAIIGLYTPETRDAFLAMPLVAGLDIATSGRLIPVEVSVGAALQTPNPVSLHYLLEQLGPKLAEAAAG